MDIQEEFINRVLQCDGDFAVKGKYYDYRFMQMHIGGAKYIYGINYYDYGDIKDFTSLTRKPVLVAVAAKGEVYAIETDFLKEGKEKTTIKPFSDYVERIRKEADAAFQPMIEALDISDIHLPEYERRDIFVEARKCLIEQILNEHKEPVSFCKICLPERHITSIFCGFETVEEAVKDIFSHDKKTLARSKAYDELLIKNIKDKKTLEDWEVAIAKAVASVPNAETLTIKNAKGETGKIGIRNLINALKWQYSPRSEIVEDCGDIAEIIYNGKILYKKDSEKRKTDYERD
jgi:hypothetical protein